MNNLARSLFEEISENWHLEAKSEDNDRYFYHTSDVNKILDGKKYYVIGRKGSGKTAIAEFISKIQDAKIFSEKLNFKAFPFNELYKLYNDGYTVPNQYISIWKYVIYSSIAKMMIKNENVDSQIKSILENIYSNEPDRLEGKIRKWTATAFSIKALSFALNVNGQISESENNLEWKDKVDILEKLLKDYLDDSKYIIVFDELDEDYREILIQSKSKDYIHLLTSLFKAVQDIRGYFKEKNIFPIVFLRDDIYELLNDTDKTKWSDLSIELDWDEDDIKKLLAFRISRAKDRNCVKPLNFEDAWYSIFSREQIRYGANKKYASDLFNFITKSTHLRPRDYMRYLQTCSSVAYEKSASCITPTIVRSQDKAFSNYLKNELQDEIYAIFPNIAKILDLFSQIRKPLFTIREFKDSHCSHFINDPNINSAEKDPDFILKILFHFSVIGNKSRTGKEFFRYKNKEARFNFNETIVVHRGLLKSLQIY